MTPRPSVAVRVGLAVGLLVAGFSVARAELIHVSSRLLDAGGNEAVETIAVDADGAMFMHLTLGATSTLGSVAGPGKVIAMFDVAGGLLWARPVLVSTSVGTVSRLAMAAAGDGGVVLAGAFGGTVDFGPGPMTANLRDAYLVKLGAGGATEWQRRYGGNQDQFATSVVVDTDRNIVIGGGNMLTVDFGGGEIRSNGSTDIFLARFDSQAQHIWSHGYGSTGIQEAHGLALGADNRIGLVVRYTSGYLDLGGGIMQGRGDTEIAFGAFDADGVHLWSRHAGSPGAESAVDMGFDADANAFICGVMSRAIDLGGGLIEPLPSVTQAGVVASYDNEGAFRWNYLIPDSTQSSTMGMATDVNGNSFVLAHNESPITFGIDVLPRSNTLLLGFDSGGAPIDAQGLSVFFPLLRVDDARERILLCANASAPVDFGGGHLIPNDSDIALASLRVRRPARVTITEFTARAVDEGVAIAWHFDADEDVEQYRLTRRVGDSASSRVIQTAPAVIGDDSFIDRDVMPGHLHTYRLVITTALDDDVISEPVSVALPGATNYLEQNSPNPFNPLTTFTYSLAQPARVAIVIYDANGAVISRMDQGMQPAGRHRAAWGGHNMTGEFVASGVYFYRLEGVPDVGARKMVLLK